MSGQFYKALLVLSLGVLLHASYSTTEWRQHARKADDKLFGSIPVDIVIETFLGFLLAMVAVLNIAGDFKEIRAAVELSQKSWENARNRPSFYGFNHRGKAFHPDYIPPAGKRSITEIPERFLS